MLGIIYTILLLIILILLISILVVNKGKKDKQRGKRSENFRIDTEPVAGGIFTSDVPVQTIVTSADWFTKMLESGLNKYYRMDSDNKVYLNIIHPSIPEYNNNTEFLGTVSNSDPTTIIKPDGKKVDLREVIALLGPPIQYTTNWLTSFIKENEGAKQISQYLTINNGVLHIKGRICHDEKKCKFLKLNCTTESICKDFDQDIGYTNDAHIGQLKMKDGTWLPIDQVFALIQGPRESFSYYYSPTINGKKIGQNNYTPLFANDTEKQFIDTDNNYISIEEFGIIDWAKDKFSKLEECVKDPINCAKSAVNNISDWIQHPDFSPLVDWAKSTGKDIASNLVALGNTIGDSIKGAANKIVETAKSTLNTIKENVYDKGLKVAGNAIADFSKDAANKVADAAKKGIDVLKSFPEIAKQAVNKAFEYIKTQFMTLADKIWSTIKTPLSMAISFYLDSVQCDYLNIRENYPEEKKDALQLLKPYFVPNIRTGLVAFVSELLIVATEGVITPIINVILPLISDYINPKIDGLIGDLLENEKIINSILSTSDSVVKKISFSCDWLKPPSDADELKADITKLTDTNITTSSK
jgi:hypothetical protein